MDPLKGEPVKGPLNLRSVAGGRRQHRACGKEFGAAKQEFRDEADINRILSRYRAAGISPEQIDRRGFAFGDDTGYKTYAEAHEALEVAKEHFLKLPPEIRLELGNDPGRYAELASEDGVRKVLERIGKKERRRIQDAMALVRAQTPPTPQPAGAGSASPAAPGGVPPQGAQG